MMYPGFGRMSPEYDLSAKNRICTYIFRSAIFQANQEESIDVQPDFRSSNELPFYNMMRTNFLNVYMITRIGVGEGETREHVFKCLTRQRPTNTMMEYFLSPLYNVNESADFDAKVIRGRFVFTRNANTRLLNLFAIAEEPAVSNKNVIFDTFLAYYRGRDEAQPRK